ncbi:Zinc finger protein CONSTANS-LIKE 13 [Linum grandiflorum]
MSDSTHPPMKSEDQDNAQNPPRLCDYCNQTTAVLYCRADSARLCLSCDREVHSTNQLFTKHTRCLLCDACDASPASIFCQTDRSVLCQNCDWENHNLSLSSLHNRRPIEGFTDCPSAAELVALLGFEDLGVVITKKGFADDGFVGAVPDGSDLGDAYSDFLLWDSSPVGSFDDLIVSGDSAQNLKAMGVPPLPKASKQHPSLMFFFLKQILNLVCL